MGLGRVLLVAFGGDYWFLGHSAAFLVFGAALARAVAVRAQPVSSREAADARLRAEEGAALRARGNLPLAARCASWSTISLRLTPRSSRSS